MLEAARQPTFDPVTIVTELSTKLSARTRHISVFLGAGASMTAGLPDLSSMSNIVVKALTPAQQPIAQELARERNLEQMLTRLRRIAAIADGDEQVGGFTAAGATELDKALCAAIVGVVSKPPGEIDAFRSLGIWAAGVRYTLPVEIFTINYDTLIEAGLEAEGVPYFDGFVGSLKAQFRDDLVEVTNPLEASSLPSTFVRLWKLHGSVNWLFQEDKDARSVVRLGVHVASGDTAAIYPSDEKYDDSRRVPFVVLMDRFRHALAMPESSTIICGYSFSDQHLNEIIFDAAKRFPRSEIVVTCFKEIPNGLAERAQTYRNILVFSPQHAIVAGVRGSWASSRRVETIFENDAFLLTDFRNLAKFLAGNRSTVADVAAT
jgi:hypothetical protein